MFAAGALVLTALNFNLSRRTFELTEQGQVTDRFTKAIEQLGSDKLDVRTPRSAAPGPRTGGGAFVGRGDQSSRVRIASTAARAWSGVRIGRNADPFR